MMHPGMQDGTRMTTQAPTTDLLALMNPKNYRFLPATYTEQIRCAGKRTADSDHVATVIEYNFAKQNAVKSRADLYTRA